MRASYSKIVNGMVNIFHKCLEYKANTDLCTNGSALLDKGDTRAREGGHIKTCFMIPYILKGKHHVVGYLSFFIMGCSLIIAHQCYTKQSKQQI